MALAEICGLTEFLALDKYDHAQDGKIANFNLNFANNMELAVPPFSNVSTHFSYIKNIYKHGVFTSAFRKQPAETLAQLTKDETGREIKIKFDHGTTTLGFQYQGGVILAVDSRATGGAFIGSQTMKKIVEINDFLLGQIIK